MLSRFHAEIRQFSNNKIIIFLFDGLSNKSKGAPTEWITLVKRVEREFSHSVRAPLDSPTSLNLQISLRTKRWAGVGMK